MDTVKRIYFYPLRGVGKPLEGAESEVNMYITFADELGLILVEVDEYGISFCDGKAYFSGEDGTDYAVDVTAIREIQRG